jgi:hypothetical protein
MNWPIPNRHLKERKTASREKGGNMNNEEEIIDSQDGNAICEAAGCVEKATNIVEVDVGPFGQISLSLCVQCIGRFQDK